MENNFLFSEKEVEFLNFRLIRNPNSPSHIFLMKPNTTEYPLSRKVLSGEAFSGEPNMVQKKPNASLPPIVPGWPLVGNLLQLNVKRPQKTFTKWAEIYGPIYSIKTGATTLVIVNGTDVAKEATVTRFSSMSQKKLSNAIEILTSNKSMVVMSDYNEFYKRAKRNLILGFLSPNAQKGFRVRRDTMIRNIVQTLHNLSTAKPDQPIVIKPIMQKEIFGVALKQLGAKFSRDELFEMLVIAPLVAVIDVDWRDFFPYLRWVPFKTMQKRIKQVNQRSKAVVKALIEQQKIRIASGEVLDSFTDFLLSKPQQFTEEEMHMLVWEPIIGTSNTTVVTTEWAIYELAKNKDCQNRLYGEIQSVCGYEKITEEHLPQLSYLNAVFHETIRKHSPVPILPPIYAHEDSSLGGYHIPAGSEIVVNIYGCNMDKKYWNEPETWKPERFLSSQYESMDMFKTMGFTMTISCMAIGTFVQEFLWSLKEGQSEEVDTIKLTSHRLHPLETFIEPRKFC
ncbi:hypothetical protein ACHQM5_004787 [Ranunculus cassubicifolius]